GLAEPQTAPDYPGRGRRSRGAAALLARAQVHRLGARPARGLPRPSARAPPPPGDAETGSPGPPRLPVGALPALGPGRGPAAALRLVRRARSTDTRGDSARDRRARDLVRDQPPSLARRRNDRRPRDRGDRGRDPDHHSALQPRLRLQFLPALRRRRGLGCRDREESVQRPRAPALGRLRPSRRALPARTTAPDRGSGPVGATAARRPRPGARAEPALVGGRAELDPLPLRGR